MPEVAVYQKRCLLTRQLLIFDTSTRVLVRPIGLDMVEVGGSNPPGHTKFWGLCFYSIFFQNRAFWLVSVRGHYRTKIMCD